MSMKLLSEETLSQLETRIAKRDDATVMESACGEYNCPCHYQLAALCQTVRAAWANEIRLATGLVNIYHVIKDEYCDSAIGLGMATSAVSSLIRECNEALSQCADLHRDIAALREQLAEAQFWKKQAEGWIAGVEERETAVCPEDTPFDDYIRTLQSRLAQVEKERNDLRSSLDAERRAVNVLAGEIKP